MKKKLFILLFLSLSLCVKAQNSTPNRASSLTYKTWESTLGTTRIEYVRESDGMMTETSYIKCVCMGIGGCNFCGGTGEVIRKKEYRYIEEYYTNGAYALWVTSMGSGPKVYSGGIGYIYNTNGNSEEIREEGGYYKFGGEIVNGIKTISFTLSKDYKTLWMGREQYHLINKAEFDRMTNNISGKFQRVHSSSSTSGTNSGGASSSSQRSNSTYTRCTDCNGTGRCRHCNGKGNSVITGYTETCVVCNGTGSCKICYGRGKL